MCYFTSIIYDCQFFFVHFVFHVFFFNIYKNLHKTVKITDNITAAVEVFALTPFLASSNSLSSTTKAGTDRGSCSKVFTRGSSKWPRLLRAKRWLANFNSRSFSSRRKTSSGKKLKIKTICMLLFRYIHIFFFKCL